MRNRGIRERVWYLGNPFPKGHTEQSLARAAGFKSLRGLKSQEFFRWMWKYNSGAEGELLVLEPDSIDLRITLRDSECEELRFATRDAALAPIIIADPRDVEEVMEKSIERLDRALNEYTRGGSEFIQYYQQLNQLSEDQLSKTRHEIAPAWINQEAEKVLEARLDQLRAKLDQAA